MQFKIGDFGRLNSGGPTMKVVGVHGDEVVCIWPVNGEIESNAFPAACLTKVHPDAFVPTGEPAWVDDLKTTMDALDHI